MTNVLRLRLSDQAHISCSPDPFSWGLGKMRPWAFHFLKDQEHYSLVKPLTPDQCVTARISASLTAVGVGLPAWARVTDPSPAQLTQQCPVSAVCSACSQPPRTLYGNVVIPMSKPWRKASPTKEIGRVLLIQGDRLNISRLHFRSSFTFCLLGPNPFSKRTFF